MADKAYTEPTNKQLAVFLAFYIPKVEGVSVEKAAFEIMLDTQPEFREGALRSYCSFQDLVRVSATKSRRIAGGAARG